MQPAFWDNPPWVAGFDEQGLPTVAAKHRLGLQPITTDRWLVADPARLAHKQWMLEHQYDSVVAVDASAELPRYQEWALPTARLGHGSAGASVYRDEFVHCFAEISEDVCVLNCADDFRLVAACVCAPSYWSIAEKVGRPLFDVHAPVNGMNEKLGDRIQQFLARLPIGRPFYRVNWFVHGDTDYFHSRPETMDMLGEDPAGWFFRSERQVLYKPEDRFLVFTIGVERAPVAELVQYPAAAASLLSALEIMSADEVTHFGGIEKFRTLREYAHGIAQ